MAALVIVGTAIFALVYDRSKRKRPKGSMCNRGNCEEKGAATLNPEKNPIILETPRISVNRDDTVEIGNEEPFGNTKQINIIRKQVKQRKDNDASEFQGIYIGMGAIDE